MSDYEPKERLRVIVEYVLPMAMWESCMYRSDADAIPTTHCCDWNEVVEMCRAALADDPSSPILEQLWKERREIERLQTRVRELEEAR